MSKFPVPHSNKLSACSPPPPDLTQHLSRSDDRHYTGGGFSDVYRCWYHSDGLWKEVAVKAFRFKFAIDGNLDNRSAKMLRRELGIWRRLDHINVVPFLGIAYGYGMHDAVSLVSSWMPNGSLHVFLEKYDENLGPEHRLQLLLDIANGLHYLHSIPIAHGDLNSNNVLIDEDYNACLADFGHSSFLESIPEALNYLQMTTARPGALRWNAPEQLDLEGDSDYTRTTKNDIYSFGCLGLQTLSGKVPWSEVHNDAAVVLRLSKGQKPGRPASRIIHDAHWELIQHCWSCKEERPTAGEIIVIIRKFLDCFSQRQSLRNLLTHQSDHFVIEPAPSPNSNAQPSASSSPSASPPPSAPARTSSNPPGGRDVDWNALTTFNPPVLGHLSSQQPQQPVVPNAQVQSFRVSQPVTAPYSIPSENGSSPMPIQSEGTFNQQIPHQASQIGRSNLIPFRTGGTPHQMPGDQLPAPGMGSPGGQKVSNLVWQGVGITPLDKLRFEATYSQFCRSQNRNPSLEVLINEIVVKFHLLHVRVMLSGGGRTVTAQDMWAIIGGQLGIVPFPGNEYNPPRCGPESAQQLRNAYEQYLQHFEDAFVLKMRNLMGRARSPQQPTSQMNPNSLSVVNTGTPLGMPGNPTKPRNQPYLIQQAVVVAMRYAHVGVEAMRALQVPESMINFVDRYRTDLIKLYQQQLQEARRNAE